MLKTIYKGFFDLFLSIFSIFKIPLIIVALLIAIFLWLIVSNILIGLFKGKKFQKSTSYTRQKKRGFFCKIFIDLPKRIVDDMFAKNPDFFPYQGLIIFEGRQGNGKTISAIQFARQMQREYSKSKVITNLNYKFQNDELNHWSKLINYKNGIYGVIAVLDETQNWFASNQSKNFPPEMLQVITQNRKNRRIILGTAQNFYLLAKAIRSQTTEVRRCATFFGCLTLVRRFEPILDSEGNVQEFKKRGFYFYVHDQELRDSYDTYHVIESLSNSGFKENADLLANNTENTTNNVVLINQKGK